jgi:hypothetical protein
MGSTGVARRRLIEETICPGRRDGERGHRRSKVGEAEVQYWAAGIGALRLAGFEN